MAVIEGFGKRLRAARMARGIGLRDLSRRVGLSHAHLSNVEAGRWGLTLAALCAVCRELEVSADYLLGLEKGKETT